MKAVKPLSNGDKGETPEFVSAQEITLSAPLSTAECRFKSAWWGATVWISAI